MNRRIFLPVVLVSTLSLHLAASAAEPIVEIYKSEYCGCCSEWVKHMESNGFKVITKNVANPSDYRQKLGIPQELGSCHTGFVQGYALEGHVPAVDIKRLLAEKPKAKGLAVPSMPMGSPGMDGTRKDPFDVMLVHADGRYSVYKHYN
jgi:hypothetical protein